jgi:hypothetical protein
MEGKLVCVVPLSQKHDLRFPFLATGNTTLKIVPIGALARNFRTPPCRSMMPPRWEGRVHCCCASWFASPAAEPRSSNGFDASEVVSRASNSALWSSDCCAAAMTFPAAGQRYLDLADDFMSAKCPIELPVLSYSFLSNYQKFFYRRTVRTKARRSGILRLPRVRGIAGSPAYELTSPRRI